MTGKENVWSKLGRKKGQFEVGDVGIARNGGYVNNPYKLRKYYECGDLIAFYPTESIVFLKDGDLNA